MINPESFRIKRRKIIHIHLTAGYFEKEFNTL